MITANKLKRRHQLRSQVTFTNSSSYNPCTQIRQFWKATFPTTSSHSQPFIFPDKALLKSQFVLFSKFGDKASDGETIKLSQSDKWFKQVLIKLIILTVDVLTKARCTRKESKHTMVNCFLTTSGCTHFNTQLQRLEWYRPKECRLQTPALHLGRFQSKWIDTLFVVILHHMKLFVFDTFHYVECIWLQCGCLIMPSIENSITEAES